MTMTQEEKARLYDEAIERAKEINNEQRAQPFNVMTRVFPELKESEDERIRKAIKLMCSFLPNKPKYIGDVSVEDMFAWLEKQGEEKTNLNNWKPTKEQLKALSDVLQYNVVIPNYKTLNSLLKDLSDL